MTAMMTTATTRGGIRREGVFSAVRNCLAKTPTPRIPAHVLLYVLRRAQTATSMSSCDIRGRVSQCFVHAAAVVECDQVVLALLHARLYYAQHS